MEKSLPDLDKNHPFYSDEANAQRRQLIRRLIQEEEQMALENRRQYKLKNKKSQDQKEEPPIDGD